MQRVLEHPYKFVCAPQSNQIDHVIRKKRFDGHDDDSDVAARQHTLLQIDLIKVYIPYIYID